MVDGMAALVPNGALVERDWVGVEAEEPPEDVVEGEEERECKGGEKMGEDGT